MRYLYLSLLACSLTLCRLVPALEAEPPDHYVSLGIRALLNDPTSVVLGAKIKVVEIGHLSLSIRPEVLFGTSTEGRTTITGEGELAPNFYPFLGGGVAVNTDQTRAIDPMVAGGFDMRLHHQISLRLEGRMIFQTTIDDTDLEFIAALNYAF